MRGLTMAARQPVVLYGSTPATVGVNVAADISDELALRNWSNRLLQIRELRFAFETATPHLIHDPLIEVSLRIGNEEVTNGFVPIGALHWPADSRVTFTGNSTAPSAAMPCRAGFALPVFLAPGERIHAKFRLPANFDTSVSALRFHAGAACKIVEGVDPRSGYLPWFSGYTAVARTVAGIYVERSDPSVFQNNFQTPLVVDRFIGNWDLDPTRETIASAATLDDYAYGAKLIRVRCEDHLGNQLVRDATPFGVVFDQTRRYWRAKTLLAPKGFFRFTLETDFRSLTLFPRAIIGMLGFRPSSR